MAKRKKVVKRATVSRSANMARAATSGKCSGSGLEWFVIGVLILANNWVNLAWPVFIGGLIALWGLYKYIKRG